MSPSSRNVSPGSSEAFIPSTAEGDALTTNCVTEQMPTLACEVDEDAHEIQPVTVVRYQVRARPGQLLLHAEIEQLASIIYTVLDRLG